jgi:hypothetical protein
MTEVWSCGGGTQSGAIAALIASGRLPKPDLCFMTDTGREKSGTWPFVDGFIRPQLAKAGLELEVVPARQFDPVALFAADGVSPLLPGFTTQNGGVGKLTAFCSGTWKRDVSERFLRSKGIVTARQWMGISIDEMKRVRSPHRPWIQLWYPLIFALRMSRLDCVKSILEAGWTGPIPHSACYMCANQSDDEWAEMRRDWPQDFEMACALEAEMQITDPHFWLHPSCRPLATVDFSAQSTFFADSRLHRRMFHMRIPIEAAALCQDCDCLCDNLIQCDCGSKALLTMSAVMNRAHTWDGRAPTADPCDDCIEVGGKHYCDMNCGPRLELVKR